MSPTRQFGFSKRRKSVVQTNLDNSTYHDYLAGTLPRGWTADAAHIQLIAEHLDRVERGEIDRLAIHMPPRHGKSETVTYRFPVRWLERHPNHNVLVTGYNERFARKFGRRSRNLATERGMVSPGKSASDEWETNGGGLYMARGVGSPPTGTGFNLIVIDDPIRRREDADSEVYREKVWDWYTDDLYTRLEPAGAIVLIMTLWHEDDIGARAIASEPGRWKVLKLPAIAEEDDQLGRTTGEALWPDRYDLAALERIHEVMAQNDGERGWEAVFQQNPQPRSGLLFKVAKFEIVQGAPVNCERIRYWDKAGADEGKGDWTVGVLMAKDAQGRFYVEDVERFQLTAFPRNARIKQVAELDRQKYGSVTTYIEQPPGLAKEATDTVIRLLAGYNVHADPVHGHKVDRAEPYAAQVEAENVKLVKGEWIKKYMDELAAFPNSKNDDQVDASSGAFNRLVQSGGAFQFSYSK